VRAACSLLPTRARRTPIARLPAASSDAPLEPETNSVPQQKENAAPFTTCAAYRAAVKRAVDSGHFYQARDLLKQALRQYPQSRYFRLQVATQEAKHGNPHAAVPRLAAELERDPDNPHILTALAGAYRRTKNLGKARELYAQCAKLEPWNSLISQVGCHCLHPFGKSGAPLVVA
jgi:predicted Zn-dependent protease